MYDKLFVVSDTLAFHLPHVVGHIAFILTALEITYI